MPGQSEAKRLIAGCCLLVLVHAAGAGAESPAPASRKQSATSGVIDSVVFWSQSLGIRKRALVWLPPSYATETQRRYPVAYYLHGGWGDETNWTALARLEITLDSLVRAGVPEMIVVMPDGDDGFYTTWNFLGDYSGCRRTTPPGRRGAESVDTYCVPWPHYDDYVARDLVAFIDRSYRSIPDRRRRGIAGLSMGGYGAVTLALSYPDVFSAAASHSGVLAPARGGGRIELPRDRFNLDSLRASYAPNLWALSALPFGKDSIAWAARDPAVLAARLREKRPELMPALYVDCGTEDFLLHQNRAFRDALGGSAGQFLYAEYAGGHSWAYWRSHAAQSAAWLAARLAVP